jgi:hypothetical protein
VEPNPLLGTARNEIQKFAVFRSICDIISMKTIKLAEASAAFEDMFQLAVSGETVVIEREHDRVALRSLPAKADPTIAPPGYFAGDYSGEELAELNHLAAQTPLTVLP